MSDTETLAAYAPRVAEYAALPVASYHDRAMAAFTDGLAPGAAVFDLGCGPGLHAKTLMDRGYSVKALDASPEFVAHAKGLGVDARLGTFDDLTEVDVYDAVWASFSLLHARKIDLPRHIAAVAQSLRAGGRVFLGMKTGDREERDKIGRFYSYFPTEALIQMLAGVGLRVVWQEEGAERGLAGDVSPFVLLVAVADA